MTKEQYQDLVLEAVVNVLGVCEEMLKSTSRKQKYVDARKIFSYLCREKKISYQTIADCVNREHSTVCSQVEQFLSTIKFDRELRTKYFDVKLYIDNKLQNNNV